MDQAKVALVWRKNSRSSHYETRLAPIADALQATGFEVVRVAYCEEEERDVEARLAACAGVLVWINPLADGRDRTRLDAMLRRLAAAGPWLSAHPDIIAKMGVKDVLYATRSLGWGSDVRLYATLADFTDGFQRHTHWPRVLKPHRGNDGQGVVKIEPAGHDRFQLRNAEDDSAEALTFADLQARAARIFAASGRLIDQETHDTAAGMVRCYMSQGRVVGFARQLPRLGASPDAFRMDSSKEMHPRDFAPFADLRAAMEEDWTPGLQRLLDIETHTLPALWDADFLFRRAPRPDQSRFALCEINASCVSPFPDAAPAAIAAAATAALT